MSKNKENLRHQLNFVCASHALRWAWCGYTTNKYPLYCWNLAKAQGGDTVGAVTDPHCKNTPLLRFFGLLVPVGYFKNPISISLRCKYQTCFGKIETRFPRSCIIIIIIVRRSSSVLLPGQGETSWKPGDSFGSNDRCLSKYTQQTVLLFNWQLD